MSGTRRAQRSSPDLASGLIHLGILAIRGGSWMGPLSLRKPATLGLSFGLTLITITSLKPTHAVTMHAILVLPALAWLLTRTSWSERRQRRVIVVAAAGYVLLAGTVAAGNVTGVF